eukprot:m.232450 g.232450  ORF g.232450 m.232450 type:complete len:850 (-) comp17076_c2_seq4:417-2966(-)
MTSSCLLVMKPTAPPLYDDDDDEDAAEKDGNTLVPRDGNPQRAEDHSQTGSTHQHRSGANVRTSSSLTTDTDQVVTSPDALRAETTLSNTGSPPSGATPWRLSLSRGKATHRETSVESPLPDVSLSRSLYRRILNEEVVETEESLAQRVLPPPRVRTSSGAIFRQKRKQHKHKHRHTSPGHGSNRRHRKHHRHVRDTNLDRFLTHTVDEDSDDDRFNFVARPSFSRKRASKASSAARVTENSANTTCEEVGHGAIEFAASRDTANLATRYNLPTTLPTSTNVAATPQPPRPRQLVYEIQPASLPLRSDDHDDVPTCILDCYIQETHDVVSFPLTNLTTTAEQLSLQIQEHYLAQYGCTIQVVRLLGDTGVTLEGPLLVSELPLLSAQNIISMRASPGQNGKFIPHRRLAAVAYIHSAPTKSATRFQTILDNNDATLSLYRETFEQPFQEDLQNVLDSLHEDPAILNFENLPLPSSFINSLIRSLRFHSRLTHLDLSCSTLDDDGCELLSTTVWAWPHLQRLRVAACIFSTKGALALLRARRPVGTSYVVFQHLQSLDMSFNALGELDDTSIQQFSQAHPHVSLVLVGCHIRSSSSMDLASIDVMKDHFDEMMDGLTWRSTVSRLFSNPPLQNNNCLDLSGIAMTGSNFSFLTRTLQDAQGTFLTTLIMKGCDMTMQQAEELVRCLDMTTWARRVVLDLSCNQMDTRMCSAHSEILSAEITKAAACCVAANLWVAIADAWSRFSLIDLSLNLWLDGCQRAAADTINNQSHTMASCSCLIESPRIFMLTSRLLPGSVNADKDHLELKRDAAVTQPPLPALDDTQSQLRSSESQHHETMDSLMQWLESNDDW